MILDDIVARTRARLAEEAMDVEDVRLAAREMRHRRKPHVFNRALTEEGVNIIAEIKSASPSGGSIVDNPNVEQIAAEYARGGAVALSVVTEPEFFRGSREWLERAHWSARLPVLMKDFVVEPSQIFAGIAAGADAILLLASLLDVATIAKFIALLDQHDRDALVEVHNEDELKRAVDAGARLIGVNNRDLRTFHVDLATSERLGALIPRGVVRVTESGIGTPDDVQRLRNAGFDAFLVGESLLRQNDRSAAVKRLRGETP
jgi:indole-3-glycerol phosphate synthase